MSQELRAAWDRADDAGCVPPGGHTRILKNAAAGGSHVPACGRYANAGIGAAAKHGDRATRIRFDVLGVGRARQAEGSMCPFGTARQTNVPKTAHSLRRRRAVNTDRGDKTPGALVHLPLTRPHRGC
jgi:hypothetical protein